MTEMDDTFDAMHDALFEDFGQDASVRRGAGDPVAVRVIVDRGVARLGEFGQAVGRVDQVSFRNSEFVPAPGDQVLLAGVERKVDSIADDDGWVTKVTLYG